MRYFIHFIDLKDQCDVAAVGVILEQTCQLIANYSKSLQAEWVVLVMKVTSGMNDHKIIRIHSFYAVWIAVSMKRVKGMPN